MTSHLSLLLVQVLGVPLAQGDDVIQRALQALQWHAAVLGPASVSLGHAPIPGNGLQDSLQLLFGRKGRDDV